MKKRLIKALSQAALVVTLGLFLAGCENPTSGNSGPSAREPADEFKSAQNTVLEKTTDTVTLSDEAAVDAALAAWEALSGDVKALLATEKATLDGLKAKIEALKAASGPEELAEAFRTGHAAVLGKTTDTVAVSDEAAVDAALTAYEALSGDVKALLSGEKTKLDSLKAKVEELKAAAARTFNTAADLQSYLQGKDETTPASPYPVAYTGDESPAVLYAALVAAGTNKYVKLDLSGSSVGGFAAGIEAGRTRIVELTLPNSLTEIPSGTATAPTFQGFTRLTALHAPAVTTVGAYAFYSLGNLTMVSLPQADTIEFYGFGVCTNLTTVILGDTPPTIGLNIFNRLATSATTITIKVPGGKLTAYQSTIITSGKTWGDVTNKVNTDTGYFWDGFSTTRDKLTVNLESL